MNRITNQDGTVKLSPVSTEKKQIDSALAKLSKLEDLEERLQCEIEVVFSALHSGIYYLQYDKRKQRYKLVRILGSQIKIIDDGNLYDFEFKIRHKEVYVGVFNYRHAWFLDAQSAIERLEANNGDQGI